LCLETLAPAERLAFVLHDMFSVPFSEIASVVGRSPDAARQLTSRARRRVRGSAPPEPDPDLGRQREVGATFLAAARDGDFEVLVGLLDPDVVLRVDDGGVRPAATREVHGAQTVVAEARRFAGGARFARLALVNGAAGFVVVPPGRTPVAVAGFTVVEGKVAEIDLLVDRPGLRDLDCGLERVAQ